MFSLLTQAQAQSGPSKFIPRYFAIENTAQYSEYLFFAVIWDIEPKLITIDSSEKLVGGEDTASQVTLYYGDREKLNKETLLELIRNFHNFHENKNISKFSYPIKLSFWEVPADSDVVKTSNYLRIKDLNQIEKTGPNKEYLILEDTKLVIGKADGGEEVKNLLLDSDKTIKKRLPVELAIFISVVLPFLLLWIVWLIYNRFRKK
ncbi:MAG: hypothetical protein U9Q85_00880 [Patescibacteria group bacterium]|nr:hypothetical protein [Patescibacteria group bacterium]